MEESFPLLIEDTSERSQICIKTEVPDDESEAPIDEHTNDVNYLDEPGCSMVRSRFILIILI